MSHRSLWSVGASALLGALLWGAPASAESFTLETVPVSSRLAAMALQQSAADAGLQGRVVRRAELREVQFVLVVEGFEIQAEAEAAAEQLAEVTGLGVSLLLADGAPEIIAPGDAAAPEVAERSGASLVPPGADEILLRAARAMGGQGGGSVALEQHEALFVRYDRAIHTEASVLLVRHEWLASGDARRLSTQILEGEGSDSLVWLSGEEAWVDAGDTIVSRPPERVADVLERYAPARLLAWPLALPVRLSSEPRPAARVHVTTVDGQRCLQVGADDDPIQLWVEAEDWRVIRARVQNSGGEIVYVLGDWREIAPQIVVPFYAETWRDGALIEEIQVDVFDVQPEIPAGAFLPPDDT